MTPEKQRAGVPALPSEDSPKPHGGARKGAGRPKKKVRERAVTVAIVLSCQKKRTALKKRAKAAKLTPGALIEREMGL